MEQALVFRLGRVLEHHKDELGSFSKLAQRITETARERGSFTGDRDVVDRRKLARLVRWADGNGHARNVVLTLEELLAIDAYLEPFNEGLAYMPIFLKPNLLQPMVEGGEVVFLLGSKPRELHVDFSHWDVSSMWAVQRACHRLSSRVRFEFRDCLLQSDHDAARASLDEGVTAVLRDSTSSVVCVGSPRACHAAEEMLARMFGLRPFETGEPGAAPFHFVLSAEESPVPSALSLREEVLESLGRDVASSIREDRGRAMHVDGTLLLAPWPRGRETGLTYGVIAAQRRRTGEVWLVLAGLSGAGTLAAAEAATDLAVAVPHPLPDRASDVVWAVVEATVELDPRRRGRIPRIVSHRVLSGPRRWPGGDA